MSFFKDLTLKNTTFKVIMRQIESQSKIGLYAGDSYAITDAMMKYHYRRFSKSSNSSHILSILIMSEFLIPMGNIEKMDESRLFGVFTFSRALATFIKDYAMLEDFIRKTPVEQKLLDKAIEVWNKKTDEIYKRSEELNLNLFEKYKL